MRHTHMKYLFFLLLFVSGFSYGQSKEYKALLNEYYDGFPTISPMKAKEKIGNDAVYFLDTRAIKEFNTSHIKNAHHVDYDNFKLKSVKSIPKNAEIIVYCSIGARSQDIGKRLKKAGYTNVHNLYGGLFHWANIGLPMVNALERKTSTIHGFSKEWGKWVTTGNVVY